MKKRFVMLFTSIFFSVAALFPATRAFSENTVTVTDALGKPVRIRLPVKSIAAMNSDVLEILRALNAEDRIGGVFAEIIREKLFWGELVHKPKMGSWRDVDLEALARLHPDLVIAYERNPGPELEKRLKPLGIQVIRMNFYMLKTLNREIRDLGLILGNGKRAEELCSWYDRHFSMVGNRLKTAGKKPSVYVESYSDYHSAGPGSGADEICTLAGGRNIAGSFSIPYPEVNPEWVVFNNPENVVKAASWANGYEKNGSYDLNRVRDALLNRPGWKGIRAVKSGRVLVMDSGIWTGPRAVVGVCYLARLFHPDLFKDLDPSAVHREYILKFQKIPYAGVFASEDQSEDQRK